MPPRPPRHLLQHLDRQARRPEAFRNRLREDLGAVFALLADPLHEAAGAMELAESRTVVGKVVLVPTPAHDPIAAASGHDDA